jgi:hypothetical protein
MVEQFQCLCINVISSHSATIADKFNPQVREPPWVTLELPTEFQLAASTENVGTPATFQQRFPAAFPGPPDILMMLEVSHQLHYLEPISA